MYAVICHDSIQQKIMAICDNYEVATLLAQSLRYIEQNIHTLYYAKPVGNEGDCLDSLINHPVATQAISR